MGTHNYYFHEFPFVNCMEYHLECRNSGQYDTCQAGSPGAEGPFDDAQLQ